MITIHGDCNYTWDATEIQGSALAAKRGGELQDDDVDLTPHESDYFDDEDDGVDMNLVNA